MEAELSVQPQMDVQPSAAGPVIAQMLAVRFDRLEGFAVEKLGTFLKSTLWRGDLQSLPAKKLLVAHKPMHSVALWHRVAFLYSICVLSVAL